MFGINRDARRREFVEREIVKARADQLRCLAQVLASITDPRFLRGGWVDLSEVGDTLARAMRARVVIDDYLDEWASLTHHAARG
jgi:hypothetical protein